MGMSALMIDRFHTQWEFVFPYSVAAVVVGSLRRGSAGPNIVLFGLSARRAFFWSWAGLI